MDYSAPSPSSPPHTHTHPHLSHVPAPQRGYDVWGGYMSPVGDAYGKPGLAPAPHRAEMCRLASDGSESIMVDTWEANRPGYTRTLAVLRHVQRDLHAALGLEPPEVSEAGEAAPEPWAPGRQLGSGGGAGPTETIGAGGGGGASGVGGMPTSAGTVSGGGRGSGGGSGTGIGSSSSAASGHGSTAGGATAASPAGIHSPGGQTGACAPLSDVATSATASTSVGELSGAAPSPRVMLLCGADVLASMAVPGAWWNVEALLRDHGVVCVTRHGTDLGGLLGLAPVGAGAPTTASHQAGGKQGSGPAEPGSAEQAAGTTAVATMAMGSSGAAQRRGGAQDRDQGKGRGQDLLDMMQAHVIVVQEPVPNALSSSVVREELRQGRPVGYLVTPPVERYIRSHGLYGTGGDKGGATEL